MKIFVSAWADKSTFLNYITDKRGTFHYFTLSNYTHTSIDVFRTHSETIYSFKEHFKGEVKVNIL